MTDTLDYRITFTFEVETADVGKLQTEVGRMRKMINAMLEFTDMTTVKDYTSCDSSMELVE